MEGLGEPSGDGSMTGTFGSVPEISPSETKGQKWLYSEHANYRRLPLRRGWRGRTKGGCLAESRVGADPVGFSLHAGKGIKKCTNIGHLGVIL